MCAVRGGGAGQYSPGASSALTKIVLHSSSVYTVIFNSVQLTYFGFFIQRKKLIYFVVLKMSSIVLFYMKWLNPYLYSSLSATEEGYNQKARRLFVGQNLINSLSRQKFCLDLFERKGRICPIFPNRPRQNSQRGKELNKFCPLNRRDNLCLVF